MLVETDSPYLTPVPHRGKRNEPAYVRVVAETVARVKGITLEQVAHTTTGNVRQLFRI
jgi:TatD DNase family protein